MRLSSFQARLKTASEGLLRSARAAVILAGAYWFVERVFFNV